MSLKERLFDDLKTAMKEKECYQERSYPDGSCRCSSG